MLNKSTNQNPQKDSMQVATLIHETDKMSSLEIAEITGKQHAHIMRDIRSLLEQGVSESNFGLSSYKQPQPNGGHKNVPCYYLTPKGCLILASGYDALLREKIINRLEELEMKERNNEVASNIPDKRLTLKDQLLWVKESRKILNLNDASLLGMLQKIAQPYGLPVPDYTPSHGVLKSATELLREHGIGISARDFNRKLEENGLIRTLERDSSKGKKVPFKSITAKGEAYGENQVSPNNPKSTQPLWYADKFGELLTIVGLMNGRAAV